MPTIPQGVAEDELSCALQEQLSRVHQGKVRDTYAIPGHDDKLLVVATERISIFDFVLNARVNLKGEVLTALTVFWLMGVLRKFPNHLLAFGRQTNKFLSASHRVPPDLYRRAVVVRKLNMLPVECIARGYLTGSGWSSYQEKGTVCGIRLPEGLHDGAHLEFPIFTPTTKAVEGHDLPLDAADVHKRFGRKLCESTLAVYSEAAGFAGRRGIIVADTKLEFGTDSGGDLILGDEAITPDSSRFWDMDDYVTAQQRLKSPVGFDKEPVRQWGKAARLNGHAGTVDISQLDPTSQRDLEQIAQITVPKEVLFTTTERYLSVMRRLTGMSLGEFQSQVMHV